jgi:chromosome segregation ATPase
MDILSRLMVRAIVAPAVLTGVLVFASISHSNIAFAQKKTDASAEQRRAEQLRKLSAQNQQLESEKAKLTKEKEDAEAGAKLIEAKVKDAQGQSSRLSRELGALRAKNVELDKTVKSNAAEIEKLNAQLNSQKETSKAQQAELEQRARTVSAQSANLTALNTSLSNLDANNNRLQAKIKELDEHLLGQKDRNQSVSTELGACAKHNVNLVGLVDEVSEKYRKKSCADARSIVEPLVGLRRAEFERVAEEYRGKAGDERYVRPVAKP